MSGSRTLLNPITPEQLQSQESVPEGALALVAVGNKIELVPYSGGGGGGSLTTEQTAILALFTPITNADGDTTGYNLSESVTVGTAAQKAILNLFTPITDADGVITGYNLSDTVVIPPGDIDTSGGTSPTNPVYNLPPVLQSLANDLSMSDETSVEWASVQNPVAYRDTITRRFAHMWDEPIGTGSRNYFDDLSDVSVQEIGTGHRSYFSDANDPSNTLFPGYNSYVTGSRWRLPVSFIGGSAFRIILFDFLVDRSGSNSFLMIDGDLPGSFDQFMWIEEGVLQFNQFREDSSADRISAQVYLPFEGHGYSASFTTTSQVSEFIILRPDSGTFNVAVDVYYNGDLQTSLSESFTYVADSTARSLQNVTVNQTRGGSSLFVTLRLNQIINYRPSGFTTDVVAWQLTASRNFREGYVAQVRVVQTDGSHTGYASTPTHTNVFDSAHVTQRQIHHMGLVFVPTHPGENIDDPYMSMIVQLDNYQSNYLPLGLRASELPANNFTFGDSWMSLARFQFYDWSSNATPAIGPSHVDLNNMIVHSANFLGLFERRSVTRREYLLAAGLGARQTKDGAILDLSQQTTELDSSHGVGTTTLTLPANYTEYAIVLLTGDPNIIPTVLSTAHLSQGSFGPAAVAPANHPDYTARTLRVSGQLRLRWSSELRAFRIVDGAGSLRTLETWTSATLIGRRQVLLAASS